MRLKLFFCDTSGRVRTLFRLTIYCVVIYKVHFFTGTILIALLFSLKTLITNVLCKTNIVADVNVQEFFQLIGSVRIVLYYLLSTLIIVVITFAARRFLDRKSIKSLGLQRPEKRLGTSLWLAFIVGALPMILFAVVLLAGSYINFVGIDFLAADIIFIPIFVVAAFNEELIFRGYILKNILEAGHPVWAVIVSSLLFALLHGGNPSVWESYVNFINLFLAGIFFAMTYIYSGNLWFPWIIHFAWNFFQGVVLGLPVSGMNMAGWIEFSFTGTGSSLITGGNFGPEGSLLITVYLIGGIVVYKLLISGYNILKKQTP